MPSSGMLSRVALVRTNVPEEHLAFMSHVIISRRSLLRLLVTASVVPSSPILVILMVEVVCSSETSVLTKAT
jgi:hypothetical protein